MKATEGELIAGIANALKARYPNTDHVHFCLSPSSFSGEGEVVHVSLLIEVLDRDENTITSTKKTGISARDALVSAARDVINFLDPITDARNALSHLLREPVGPA